MLSFLGVGALMLLGSAIALWELDFMRERVQPLSQADQPAMAVLRVRSAFLTYQQQLLRSSGLDPRAFEDECGRLRQAFDADVAHAREAVRTLPPSVVRDVELRSLDAAQASFAAHLEALEALARTGDREAVRRRAENRMPLAGDLSESIVRDIDAFVDLRKKTALEEIRRAQLHATWSVLGVSLLAISAAALLGLGVTRRIAGRLEGLDAAARALARGDFDHRAHVGGRDEIARLSEVFNEMAGRLRGLYETLQRSEAHFRTLIEKAADFILVLDASGKVRYASPSAEREIGSDSVLVGRSVLDLADPADAKAFLAGLARAPGETPAPQELRVRDGHGRPRVLEARSRNLLADPDVAGIVVNARDITDLKHAAEERDRLQESLRRSETMAAMGSLVAGVAHEVRNPLFGISAALDALEARLAGKGQEAAKLDPYMGLLRDHIARLTRLMEDLLDYGRPSALEAAPTWLQDVIRDSLRACEDLARERGVTILADVAPGLAALSLDALRMQQVLENLITNAIQHSPRGGTVRVVAHGLLEPPRESVECRVEDEGAGLPEADVERIFEPFFSHREGGTGLGLSIVQRIVEAHGGRIVAANRSSGGAVFSLTLPRASDPAGAASRAGADPAGGPTGSWPGPGTR
jgi:PAS domain S-box-containing protein